MEGKVGGAQGRSPWCGPLLRASKANTWEAVAQSDAVEGSYTNVHGMLGFWGWAWAVAWTKVEHTPHIYTAESRHVDRESGASVAQKLWSVLFDGDASSTLHRERETERELVGTYYYNARIK